MSLKYSTLLCFPLVTLSCVAGAQQTNPEPAMQRVEVKGAGVTEQRRNDTAGRIIVARDDLQRFGDNTLSEALKRQPGLSVQGNEVRMRGLGAGYTQILINGEPAQAGFSLDSISPDLIERIEILRTAMADTSAQSVAGSINIILRKASSTAKPTAKLSVERLQERTNPAFTMQWSGRRDATSYSVAASVSRSQVHNEPYVDERSLEPDGVAIRRFQEVEDMDLRRASITPRIETKFANGDVLSWQGLFNVTRMYASGESIETTFAGTPTASPESYWRNMFETWLAKSDLSWTRRFTNEGRLTIKAGIEANNRDGDYTFNGINAARVPWFERQIASGFNERRATTTGKYITPLFDNHDMAFGWDATFTRRSEERLQRDSEPQRPPYYTLDQDYRATVGRVALYAQDEWSVSDRLQVYFGLRWEGLKTRTSGRDFAGDSTESRVWSPIAQLVWKLPGRERDQVRVALARTYKAPQPRDLVPRRFTTNNNNSPTNPDVQGNPTLLPELAWGIDMAYESYIGRDGVVSVSTYARRVRNIMLQKLWVENGKWISTPVNGGEAKAYGVEFDVKLPIAPLRPDWPTMDLRANFGRNWSRVDDLPRPNNRLAAQAPLTANIGTDLRFKSGFTAGVNLNITDSNIARLTPALTTRTGIQRQLDTYISWAAWRGQWRVSVSDVLQETRREGQLYDDGRTFNERTIFTPRDPVIRIQYEASI